MSICLDTTKQQDRPQPMTTTNGTSHKPYPAIINGTENGQKELILLSEDDEDRAMDSNTDEIQTAKNKIKASSNGPKEDDDCEIIEEDFIGNQLSVINSLQKELNAEENTLLLFQHIKDSQKPPSSNNNDNSNCNMMNVKAPLPNNTNHVQKAGHAFGSNTKFDPPMTTTMNKVPASPVVKVTKQVALNAIEQQFNAKRLALKKHLEKAFEKIPLPSPKANSGLSEIAFVPSSIVTEFSSLIGLEEVCKNIQEYETNSSKPETKKVFNPFSCSRCKTDFTPVWKREKPGSTGVVCENCLVGNHKTNLHQDFETGIRNALSQYSNAEKELEKEYDELVNNPENLETFIKEHEKKLTAAATQQAANTINRGNKGNNVNYGNNASKLVYSNGNGNANNSGAYIAQNVSALQQAQIMSVAATLAAASNAATNNSHALPNNLQSLLNAETLQSLTPVQQAHLISQLQAQAQQQQQQQQLISSLITAAKSSGNSSNNAVLTSLAASMASQQQQQAQQIQQQQLLASVIASIQQQQQQQAVVTSSQDQISQLQNALLSSLMGNQQQQQNQRLQQNQSRQQQQLQTLLQYSMLQQQAQAAAAVQQQQQQHQQSTVGLTPQQQQLALLQQMLQQSASSSTTHSQQPPKPSPANSSSSLSNSTSAANLASLNLLQSLQSLGNAAIKK